MAKSIRISDEIYELALQEAELMHRSLAQQVEHWVKLGVGVEHEHATLEDVRSMAQRYKRTHESKSLQRARVTRRTHFLPVDMVRSARLEFPADAFASGRSAW